jgi:hypothetical protein
VETTVSTFTIEQIAANGQPFYGQLVVQIRTDHPESALPWPDQLTLKPLMPFLLLYRALK